MEDNQIIINQVQNSTLSDWQKRNLVEFLPNMNDGQKKEMMDLLAKANELKGKKMAHVSKYKAIIKDYEEIVKNNQHELVHYAQGEIKKLDEKESEAQLEVLEQQIQTL